MLAGGLEWADPTDLDGLRETLEHADPEGRLAPVGMGRVEIGREALYLLPEVVSELAGFGDLISTWTAPGDWYLASAVGMDDSYHEAPVALVREQGRELLEDAAGLREGDPEALERLARVLTLSGFTLGIAGKTAPLSGTEHLVNHLVDMSAEQSGRPFALHRAQVAVAALPVAAAWEDFLAAFDPSTLDPDRLFPGEPEMEPAVRGAFARIDPSGGVGEECWGDYKKKLALWQRSRPRVERFLEDWPEHRASLREMVLPPEALGGALREACAPAPNTLLVGDRLATDIRMANECGMAGALVLTGTTTLDEALGSGDRPEYVIEHLGDLLPRQR